jgi:hypothetical protein
MAQRFLEIEISRHIFTTVNIVVDDEDEKYKDVFNAENKISHKAFHLLQDAAHQAADKIVSEYDWETDKSETEVDGMKEVPKGEAVLFECWDAKNNRKLEG